jgi:adenylosuccinate synthase
MMDSLRITGEKFKQVMGGQIEEQDVQREKFMNYVENKEFVLRMRNSRAIEGVNSLRGEVVMEKEQQVEEILNLENQMQSNFDFVKMELNGQCARLENDVNEYVKDMKSSRNKLKKNIKMHFEELEGKLEEEESIVRDNQHKMLDLIETACHENF